MLCGLQGFAYVEFMETDAVDNAIMLDNTELRGRPIKVRAAAPAVAVAAAASAAVAPAAATVAAAHDQPRLQGCCAYSCRPVGGGGAGTAGRPGVGGAPTTWGLLTGQGSQDSMRFLAKSRAVQASTTFSAHWLALNMISRVIFKNTAAGACCNKCEGRTATASASGL